MPRANTPDDVASTTLQFLPPEIAGELARVGYVGANRLGRCGQFGTPPTTSGEQVCFVGWSWKEPQEEADDPPSTHAHDAFMVSAKVLGEALMRARERRNIYGRTFAIRNGISVQDLYLIEQGELSCSERLYRRLASSIDATMEIGDYINRAKWLAARPKRALRGLPETGRLEIG